MKLRQYFPIFSWITTYSQKELKRDWVAGVTVGVMLIPQGMAYAMIAGLPPIYGLYASTLPLILYAIFGTSRQLAVGPVAMVSLLTAAGVGLLAETGTETYIALAITLALFVGLIQFLFGVFRLGFLVNFLSHPVISGFTSAAALIIGMSQLKHLLGVDIPRSHHVHEIVLHAISQLGALNWPTLAIGLGGIIIIKGIKKIQPAIPGPLITVVLGIWVVYGLGLTDQGVAIVGEVPQGLPSFQLPMLEVSVWQSLLPTALAIALVSFMESIAVAKAIQAKHKDYEVVPNQELIALGLANIGGAFFQSYPTTGGFSRTAVNDQSGAKTGMASLISALLMILTLLFLTPLFYYLPKAILASVIMVAVFGLIDLKEAKHLWHTHRTDFWMWVVTAIGTLALGIEQGIGLGVILSLGMVVYRTTRPHAAVLGKVPGTQLYRNIERFQQVEQRDDVLVIRFDNQLYFANINYFRELVTRWAAKKGPALKAIIIHAESISEVDSSAMHTLHEMVEEYKTQGISVLFAGVIGPVRDALSRSDLIAEIGPHNFFMNIQDAVNSMDIQGENEPPSPYADYLLQTNHR